MKFMQFCYKFPPIRWVHRQFQYLFGNSNNSSQHQSNPEFQAGFHAGCQQAWIWMGAIAFCLSSMVVLPSPVLALSSSHFLSKDGQNIVAMDSNDVVEQAESQLDEAAGAGTSNRIKGRFQEGVGKVKEEAGDMVDSLQQQAEGMTEQMRGRAQRDLGRSQDALEEAGETAQDKSENLIESIKDYFD
jgi:uncharacterized protein YjbJ (UPF0337 family)